MADSFSDIQDRFTSLSRDIDDYLEEKFGDLYPLHPMRPQRGATANPSSDGLFATTITFDLGYGTKTGRGYMVKVDVRTLDTVSQETKDMLTASVYEYLRTNIPVLFPERKLEAVIDGPRLKIIGDFTVSHQI